MTFEAVLAAFVFTGSAGWLIYDVIKTDLRSRDRKFDLHALAIADQETQKTKETERAEEAQRANLRRAPKMALYRELVRTHEALRKISEAAEQKAAEADRELAQLRTANLTLTEEKAQLAEERDYYRSNAIHEARVRASRPAGPPDAEDLLRRSYHALRITHDFRKCHLIGCEYCKLGEEIVCAIGAHQIASETTIRKKASE